MAELGDPLERGRTSKDVTIEMLDYDFLDKCSDPDLIRAIVRKLKSGEEGHYPDLLKVRGVQVLCTTDKFCVGLQQSTHTATIIGICRVDTTDSLD